MQGSTTMAGQFLRKALVACVAAALILSVTGCDDAVEEVIGAISSRSVEAQYRVVDDPLLTDWVEVAGNTLVGSATRQHIPYNFKVLDADIVNAFAAPYGHVYVTTGLLEFVDTEDEVWGVLGHEIGHVVHRHSLSSVKRGLMYSLGLELLLGRDQTLSQIAGVGLGLLSLKYSRDNEYEADDAGRLLAYRAGYDPRGNADFFDRLMNKYEKRRPSSIEVMFRTHPPSQSRSQRQRGKPELSTSNPEALLVTGRGYARRHETRRALEMLEAAARLRPDDHTMLLSLADVQMARGQHEDALQTYRTAAAVRPTAYANAGVQMASTARPPQVQYASAGERSEAAIILTAASSVANEARTVLARAEQQGSTIDAAIQPAVAGTHSVIDTLFDLAEVDTDMSSAVKSVVTNANASINRALEPVYSVEVQREALQEAAEQLQAAVDRTQHKLALGTQGRLVAGEVAVLERTLQETRQGLRDVQEALAELQAAEKAVVSAQDSARHTTVLVERVMRTPRDPGLARMAENSARDTESRARDAEAAVRKAKKVSDRAVLRALLARINTTAVGAPPALQPQLDGMVGHYTMRQAREVARLRQEGVGYGDAALLLATSRGVSTPPVAMAREGVAGKSLLDQVTSAGASTRGALVMLRYLAGALEYELDEAD